MLYVKKHVPRGTYIFVNQTYKYYI